MTTHQAIRKPLADIPADPSLYGYLRAIKQFPLLSPEEEYMLAKRFAVHGDTTAAQKLVTSHLRLVAKIAMGYRSTKVAMLDLISEGNIGLMRAVRKFDPDRGFRLATYAMWWIKAAIHEHLINSWSLVKIGTVAAQKKLFFNLRRVKAKLGILQDSELAPDAAEKIATELAVPVAAVIEMNRRLAASDSSLNRTLDSDGEVEKQDLLRDDAPDQEEAFAEREEFTQRHKHLMTALGTLNARERRIFQERRLLEEPRTLDDIGAEYGISRERVRQIENVAFRKVQAAVLAAENAKP